LLTLFAPVFRRGSGVYAPGGGAGDFAGWLEAQIWSSVRMYADLGTTFARWWWRSLPGVCAVRLTRTLLDTPATVLLRFAELRIVSMHRDDPFVRLAGSLDEMICVRAVVAGLRSWSAANARKVSGGSLRQVSIN